MIYQYKFMRTPCIYFVDGCEITLREVPEGNFLAKVQGERN